MSATDVRLLAHLHEFELRGEEVYRKASGKPVGSGRSTRGYRAVSVGPRKSNFQVLYHRLKFALLHGWLPVTVDHEDGNNHNDLASNLRAATYTEQNANRRQPSGPHRKAAPARGVTQAPSGRWRVKTFGRYQGTFDTLEQAQAHAGTLRLHAYRGFAR